jgi:hypothetical protein
MAIGDLITAARYNNIQARIATVMGTGSGSDGYGQTLTSSTVSVGSTVTALHMQNLYDDMFAARVHQTGTAPTQIADMVVGNTIGENDSENPNGTAKGYTDFEGLLPSIEGDKFLLHPSQASVEAAITSSRTTDWNGVITHEFTVTFASENDRRYFFNAGGEIRFSAALTNAVGSKDTDWATLLANMGTIKFNYTETSATGTGTGSAIGNYDLTATYQQIFIKDSSGVYAENDYNINARSPTTTTLQFRIQFRDDDAGDPDVDESITGDITSTIQQLRPSGLYVNVTSPSYANNTTL